ncbi:MAG TPA: YceI family protein [Kiritimatiellia bacterium]|nr:YceI family protein [Kiritimatiellia bacterium]
MRSLLAIALGLCVSAAAVRAEVYEVDAVHSTVGFGVRHMVVTTVKGNFGEFSGTVSYDAADSASLKISGVVKAASINTGNEKRDDHLRNSDFFDVEKFPEITFESTKFENGVLTGNLTMKGVTKEISMPATVNGPVTHPFSGKQAIGVDFTTKINRQDYGISWSKSLDGGGLLVGDEVTLELSIQALK